MTLDVAELGINVKRDLQLTAQDALSLLMIIDTDWRGSLRRDGLGAEVTNAENAIVKLVAIEHGEVLCDKPATFRHQYRKRNAVLMVDSKTDAAERVVISKHDIVDAVLEAIDAHAACTAGVGGLRSDTLNDMPRRREHIDRCDLCGEAWKSEDCCYWSSSAAWINGATLNTD